MAACQDGPSAGGTSHGFICCRISASSFSNSSRRPSNASAVPSKRLRPRTRYAGTETKGKVTSETDHATAPCAVRTVIAAWTAKAMPAT
jgi:hypothetical protein